MSDGFEQPVESSQSPIILVVFGATGDLSKSKLLPALFNLHEAGTLPPLTLICVANEHRKQIESKVANSLLAQADATENAASRQKQFLDDTPLHYLTGDVANPRDKWPEHLSMLIRSIGSSDTQSSRIVYYYALYPVLYRGLTERLVAEHMLTIDDTIVLEKPYGTSKENALGHINYITDKVDKSPFLVDHYLYKSMARRLNQLHHKMSTDQKYELLGRTWNGRYIDHVQITIAETEGIDDRVVFYEKNGALYDMVQNHMLQLLCVIAKELPSYQWGHAMPGVAAPVQREFGTAEEDVLAAILKRDKQFTDHADQWLVPGQFKGYREISGVEEKSDRETYVALRLELDTGQWQDVPFFLRTGKCLSGREAHIAIEFRTGDRVVFYIQPNPRIVVRRRTNEVPLAILTQYEGAIEEQHDQDAGLPVVRTNGRLAKWRDRAYERILTDVLRGEVQSPVTEKWVRQSWKLMSRIENAYVANFAAELAEYTHGTQGPSAADELISKSKEGRRWLPLPNAET